MTQPAETGHAYTSSFYDSYAHRSQTSAREVLSIVLKYLSPASIADVGCGVGTWLAAAQELGIEHLAGFDGQWVNPEELLSDEITFQSVDFESDFALGARADLCISMEVAEHISEAQADHFVEQLCQSSEVVLFSAAIPCQGGAHHVNEQLQSYWVKKFAARSYECFDVIRHQVWDNDAVEFWYRQNAFLFVHPDCERINRDQLREDHREGIIDIVHPGFFAWKLHDTQQPGFRSLLRHARNYARFCGRSLEGSASATMTRVGRFLHGAPARQPQP